MTKSQYWSVRLIERGGFFSAPCSGCGSFVAPSRYAIINGSEKIVITDGDNDLLNKICDEHNKCFRQEEHHEH